MDKRLLRGLYEKRGYGEDDIKRAISSVLSLENWLIEQGSSLETAPAEEVKHYVEEIAAKGESSEEGMLALSRYFYLSGRKDVYLYLARVTGGVDVIENIKNRMCEKAGKEKADTVFEGLSEPPIGTPAEKRPEFIKTLMQRAQTILKDDVLKESFAGNNHGIPASSMEAEKKAYEASSSLDEYLKQRHERKVEELQRHCDSGEVWFEQIITQDVVDFVASNQEILSAVRDGSTFYVTKIPYDIVSFLKEDDAMKKSYYACHCPFVRESIVGEGGVSENWCYCSGGFAKFPFEQVLGRELKVKLLKSAIGGDEICRFAIDIGEDFK